MSDKRDTFIFYRSFYEAIKQLDNEDKLKIYDAIAEYSLNGETTELSNVPKAIFTLIQPFLEKNNERYKNGCKGAKHGIKGAKHGIKGGRPKNKPPINPPPNPRNKDKDKDKDKEGEREGGTPKFSNRKAITKEVQSSIAKKYKVSLVDVTDCWDSACNWLDTNGRVKKNYKTFLANWVKEEIKKKRIIVQKSWLERAKEENPHVRFNS